MVESAGIPRVEGIEGLEPIGRGGFATVYRGRQPTFGRDVAVKVLNASGIDTENRRRFERECQVMGTLSGHPGIVPLYDAGFTGDGRAYLVMPYYPDGTLQDRLGSGPLPWSEAAVLGVQLAGALETAHRAGVVHRDVKPGNILRSQFGNQLTDFGIARLQGAHETLDGVVTASIAHAAPEILDGEPPTEVADVYSLGSTLFQALAGRSAFARAGDESLLAVVHRVMMDPVPDLRDLGVPSATATVVETAMAKQPIDRYPTAAALGRALQQAQASMGTNVTELMIVGDGRGNPTTPTISVAVPPPGAPPAPPTGTAPLAVPSADADHQDAQRRRSPRSGWWAVAIALAGVGALTAAAVALLAGSSDDTDSTPLPRLEPPAPDTAVTPTTAASTAPAPTTTPDQDGEPTTTSADDTADTVLAPNELVSGEVLASFELAPTTQIGGRTIGSVDGIDWDPERGDLLAIRDTATGDLSESRPELTDATAFTLPLAIDTTRPSALITLDPASGSSATLTSPSGGPYGPELDVEGAVSLDGGDFLVVSEGSAEAGSVGGPFIHRFDATARFQAALEIPSWYVPDAQGTVGFTPFRGLHGIDRRPGMHEEVVVIVEAPLLQDHDPAEPTEPKVARIVAFDVATGDATTEWGYPLERISAETAATYDNAQSLVVDVAALGDRSLAVLESTLTAAGEQNFSLYRVDLDDGNPPSPTLPGALDKEVIELGGGASIDSIGSVGAGPDLDDGRPTLIVATDNGFDDEPTRIEVLAIGPAS